MATLAPAPRLVKAPRLSRRAFGRGAFVPTGADRAWAAQALNADTAAYCLAGESCPPTGLTGVQLDELAEVSAAIDRMSRGFPA